MAKCAGFRDVFYSAQDGLRLHLRDYPGDRDALPVVCLPGLTRNARDFHELAIHLSQAARRTRRVVSFDYRGRGLSERDRNWRNYDVRTEANDVLAGLAAIGIEHACFIGTSRGGIIVHVLAASRPTVLKAAILNDIGPVIDGAGLAQIRAYLSRAATPESFEEAVTYLRAANGVSFSALSLRDWERTACAIYDDKDGKPIAAFDPALTRTITSVDLSKPLPELWPQFMGLTKIPVLAIRGENSKLFGAATLEAMAERHPDLDSITVEGKGHAPLLETGDLPQRIAAFIERADRRKH